MKRYYLSKIKQINAGGFNTWRHRLQDDDYVNVEYQGGEIHTDANGIPTEKALLVLVGGVDHRQFADDPELIPVPDVGLDIKISATHTVTKLQFKQAMIAMGHAESDVDEVVENANGWRDVINTLGQRNNPDFDARNFDLDDL